MNEIDGNVFGVNIVPHTFSVTILDELKVNSQVNIEIDIIARHIEQLLNNKTSARIDKALLIKNGYL